MNHSGTGYSKRGMAHGGARLRNPLFVIRAARTRLARTPM